MIIIIMLPPRPPLPAGCDAREARRARGAGLRVGPAGSDIYSVYIYSVYIYIHTYMHACIHTCMHAYIHTYIHVCVYIYIYTLVLLVSLVCIYIYIYIDGIILYHVTLYVIPPRPAAEPCRLRLHIEHLSVEGRGGINGPEPSPPALD